MSREFARQFYNSKAWQRCRSAYRKSVGGLCELCLQEGRYEPGIIVHHINHVTPDTITDEKILFDEKNLQLVCRDCHAKLHGTEKRYKVDELGRITAR